MFSGSIGNTIASALKSCIIDFFLNWNKTVFLGLRTFSNGNVLHKGLPLQDWVFRLGLEASSYATKSDDRFQTFFFKFRLLLLHHWVYINHEKKCVSVILHNMYQIVFLLLCPHCVSILISNA